ncbi:MAG: WD40/YVTN/BNR-like repeat-containing protein [Acidobacteriota bacterium]
MSVPRLRLPCLALAMALPLCVHGDGGWRRLDLHGANVSSLVFCATEPGGVIAGTDNGLYRSRDGGLTWVELGPEIGQVRSVAIHPRFGREIWAAAVEAGPRQAVWRSEDGGATFVRNAIGLQIGMMRALALDVEDIETAYLCADRLLVSRNGGASWEQAAGAVGSRACSAVVTAPGAVFAVTWGFADSVVHRSTDHGATWTECAVPAGGGFIGADASGATVWVAGETGLTVSRDGGVSWRSVPAAAPEHGSVTGPLAVSADGSVVLVYAQRSLLATRDGGETWAPASYPPRGYADVSTVAPLRFDPFDATRVLAVVPGGVARSEDGGASWVASNQGLANVTVEAILRARDGSLWVATYAQGIFRSIDGGATWTYAGGTLPYAMWREEAPNFFVTSLSEIEGGVVAGTTGGPFVTRDLGASWAWLGGTQGIVLSVTSDPGHPGRVVVAAAGSGMTSGGLFVSPDGGVSWTEKLRGGIARAAAVDAASGTLLASVIRSGAQPFEGIIRSTDHGDSWSDALPAQGLISLASDPARPGRLWAVGRSVYGTDDGGITWSLLGQLPECGGGCAAPVLLPDPRLGRLLAAEASHILEGRDGGATWHALPAPPVPRHLWFGIDPTAWSSTFPALALDDTGRLFAGTSGVGLFVLDPETRVPRRRLSR